jgi:transposase
VRHALIRRLALALREATHALTANRAQLQAIVNELAPGLTSQRGIRPVSPGQAIVSFSHPRRCRHAAAFAALAGTSPLEASSGHTVRHRLRERRRPGPQPCHPHHRRHPDAQLPHHPRLLPATDRADFGEVVG